MKLTLPVLNSTVPTVTPNAEKSAKIKKKKEKTGPVKVKYCYL